MKKTVNTLFLLALLFCTKIAAAGFKEDFEAKYPEVKNVEISKSFKNFYSIKNQDSSEVFISDDFKFLIRGTILDLETGHNVNNAIVTNSDITKKSNINSKPKIDISELNLDDAIKIGNGANRLYIFSDPQCPYCKNLENVFGKIKDVTVYIFPLPLISIHPHSEEVAISIWCSENREKSWTQYVEQSTEPILKTCSNPIQRVALLASKYSINATPTIVFSDGSKVIGAVEADFINQKIKEILLNGKEIN